MALSAYTSLSTVAALDCRPVAGANAPELRVRGRCVVPDWVTSTVVPTMAIAAAMAPTAEGAGGAARNLGFAVA